MRFKIYHTNDIHCNYDFLKRVYVYLKKNREPGDLYFDSGDLTDLKDLIVQGDNGCSLFKLFSWLKCSALTLGNGEIDLGKEGIESAAFQANIICTNVSHNDDSLLRGVKKSEIIEVGGYRFLILGVSPYYRKGMVPNGYNVFSMMNDVKVHEPFESLREELSLRAGTYDYSILLSHSAVEVDREFKKLGIDIILGGHSHDVVNEPFYSQSGKGEYLGVMELEVDDRGLKEVINYQEELSEVSDIDFERLLDLLKEGAEEALSEPLELAGELNHDFFKESETVNLVCDALRKEYGGELAIMHNGIAEKGLYKPVSRKYLLECFPSKLNGTKFKVLGKHIYEAYRLSLDDEHIHSSGRGPGFRGQVLGTLSFSSNVKIIGDSFYIDGKELEAKREYIVIGDDYLQRGSGYPMLACDDELAEFYGWFIRDLVFHYLNDEELFKSARRRRR